MYIVLLGNLFLKEYPNFPQSDLDKIDLFIEHYSENGFEGLDGKNVPSCNVPKDDGQFISKVNYARLHKLWHFHIGIPTYIKSQCGTYTTSEYVLHYQRLDVKRIKIIDFGSHPPLKLPTIPYLD